MAIDFPSTSAAPPLFDTHCHLDQEEFDADRDGVLARASAAGVTGMLAVAVTASSSRVSLALAQSHPEIYAAVGIHPNYTAQAAEGDWDRVLQLVGQDRVVALGETGLDCHWDYAPLDLQQDFFDRHLRLSQQADLPFIVHCRDSEEPVMAMLREARQRGPVSGIMHSFTGTMAMAQECLDLGLHVSFAGMVTFKKSDALRDVARLIPAERLLMETDSPYLSPHPLRGKRNEPSHLVHTAQCLAEARGVDVLSLAKTTTANARRLFRLEIPS